MNKRALLPGLLFSTATAFAQLDSNSVTVTASRNAPVQADVANFSVYVVSGVSVSLADVLAALQGSPITASNFIGIGGVPSGFNVVPATGAPSQPQIQWGFALAVPISKIKDTVALLTALQTSIAQNNSGLALTFNLQGTQVSTQARQSAACSITDLLSDARAQAQKIADASVLTLGPILAMSGATGLVPVCSITVKFGLVRFQ